MSKHGGKREGAGRKPKPPEQKYVRLDGVTLPPEVAAWLQAQRGEGETTSEALARLLGELMPRTAPRGREENTMMTVPEMYAEAVRLLEVEKPETFALGSAHPDYQEALKRLVDRLARDNR